MISLLRHFVSELEREDGSKTDIFLSLRTQLPTEYILGAHRRADVHDLAAMRSTTAHEDPHRRAPIREREDPVHDAGPSGRCGSNLDLLLAAHDLVEILEADSEDDLVGAHRSRSHASLYGIPSFSK